MEPVLGEGEVQHVDLLEPQGDTWENGERLTVRPLVNRMRVICVQG
jgi:hypothetical protein